MKVLQILVFFILVCGLSFIVKAQACSPTIAKFYIYDSKDNSIDNATIETFELLENDSRKDIFERDWTKNGKAFQVSLGLERSGTFLFRISATGFETIEQKIYFPGGIVQSFALRLRQKGTNEKVSFEKLATLHGTVYSNEFSTSKDAKITATDESGRVFEGTTDSDGMYKLELPAGLYTINFEHCSFVKVVFNQYKIDSTVNSKLDVKPYLINKITISHGCNGITDEEVPVEMKETPLQNTIILQQTEKKPNK